MIQAARCALAELNLTKNALSAALAELKSPSPDYERVYAAMHTVAEHNKGQNDSLQTLADLLLAYAEANMGAFPEPRQATAASEANGSNVVRLHPTSA